MSKSSQWKLMAHSLAIINDLTFWLSYIKGEFSQKKEEKLWFLVNVFTTKFCGSKETSYGTKNIYEVYKAWRYPILSWIEA